MENRTDTQYLERAVFYARPRSDVPLPRYHCVAEALAIDVDAARELCDRFRLSANEVLETGREEPRIYRIIRAYRDGRPSRTTRNNVTLAEARAHCASPEARGILWSDRFDYVLGCAPREGD